jgi:circadian clock protein KaiB
VSITKKLKDATARFEKALARPPRERYVLRLFVTGSTRRSREAIESLKALCAEHLPGRHDLEIIDLQKQPQLAAEDHVLALPTLVKKSPPPMRHVIGNLWNHETVLSRLGLQPKAARVTR